MEITQSTEHTAMKPKPGPPRRLSRFANGREEPSESGDPASGSSRRRKREARRRVGGGTRNGRPETKPC
ncbi:hypothetical protein [Cohnella algarum]|uniref:hypothetical protein n=1 Tax=Cohnella algarum TaxID=2044859 RepID=UPI00196868C1|nr:hypothetical protein [Cohnella algarum]MBN2979772.1 hypothetical protein [Cohnella algarum]